MTPSRPLTTKQQEWLSHVERAQEQCLSLQEYARRSGIKASSLYAARKNMIDSQPKALPAGMNFTEVRSTEPCVEAVCTPFNTEKKWRITPAPSHAACIARYMSKR